MPDDALSEKEKAEIAQKAESQKRINRKWFPPAIVGAFVAIIVIKGWYIVNYNNIEKIQLELKQLQLMLKDTEVKLSKQNAELKKAKEATDKQTTKLTAANKNLQLELAENKKNYEDQLSQLEFDISRLADFGNKKSKDLLAAEKNVQEVKAKLASIEEAQKKAKRRGDKIKGIPIPEMVTIKGGSLLMGDKDGKDREKPAHKVTIKPFAMSKYEITFAEYDRFAIENNKQLPDDSGWGRGNRPVINVSWDEAREYAVWLTKKTGEKYRLPTEAEWEYAARAGETTSYSCGENPSCLEDIAWYGKNSWGQPHPVGEKEPNKWGLFDMAGNVWEWVEDDWHDNYKDAPDNGSAWIDNPIRGSDRVMRGGCWINPAQRCQSAYRRYDAPGYRSHVVGFRLSRSVSPGP